MIKPKISSIINKEFFSRIQKYKGLTYYTSLKPAKTSSNQIYNNYQTPYKIDLLQATKIRTSIQNQEIVITSNERLLQIDLRVL